MDFEIRYERTDNLSQRVEHDLTESEKRCPCCDQTRQRIGEVSHEQLEFIPASLKVIRHVRFKYARRMCMRRDHRHIKSRGCREPARI
ncbi:IS66 family transposase zinc-finger binding domain-containing protein [Gimesia sp.]|uniref:IS66 family transposase zinc-finger binding domain-containing protein n=1 Tax=Gimesia sp. TaxID=2024833 RepID=UPI003A959420